MPHTPAWQAVPSRNPIGTAAPRELSGIARFRLSWTRWRSRAYKTFFKGALMSTAWNDRDFGLSQRAPTKLRLALVGSKLRLCRQAFAWRGVGAKLLLTCRRPNCLPGAVGLLIVELTATAAERSSVAISGLAEPRQTTAPAYRSTPCQRWRVRVSRQLA